MKALIFGCGYLGRRVAERWRLAGYQVFAVTRSAETAEVFWQNGLNPVVADVCREDSLSQLREVDVVLYSIGYDRNSGRTREEVTCGGLKNALSAMSTRCRRFIYISSTSVYGQANGEWVDEDSVCEPIQEAGRFGVQAEMLVRQQFANDANACFTILRLAGIYGPNRLLSRIESLKQGAPLTGRGDAWLNLIHVDDAASTIELCAASNWPSGTYDVVDDRPLLRQDYYTALAKLVGAPTPTFDESEPPARGSGGLNKRCSNKKLRDAGWAPLYPSIESGLPVSI